MINRLANGSNPLGVELSGNKDFEGNLRTVIGRVEKSAAGHARLDIGTMNSLGSGWTKTTHVTLTQNECAELADVLGTGGEIRATLSELTNAAAALLHCSGFTAPEVRAEYEADLRRAHDTAWRLLIDGS